MFVENFSSMESQVLSYLNNDINTFDGLLEKVSFGEKSLSTTLENLISRNVLVFDMKKKIYHYSSPVDKEMVVLDGNILLPTTIIRCPEKGIMYVTRGCWYEFPIDFDIRRIIWNVRLVGKGNSTLIDMIRTSVVKERKTKIKHNSEYDILRNKIVNYCPNFGLIINAVGDEATDVTIRFNYKITDSQTNVIHKGFKVNSEISTKELFDTLKTPAAERNYAESIKLNYIYNFSDFVFKDNEIPVSYVDGIYTYVKVSAMNKKGLELKIMTINESGVIKQVDTEYYDNPVEGFEALKKMFSGLASQILMDNKFYVEFTE